MEAILEKKPPKMTGRWASRLFRLKDRRMMYFKKDVTDFNLAIDSSAKYNLDLTHLISLTFDKKHPNVMIIRHPMLDLALRFNSDSLFMSWLKVLSSFNYKCLGPKICTGLPSNYLYSIWNVLQSLYTHPLLSLTEGIFRISGDKKEKQLLFNSLLQQTYNVDSLRNYKDIHILANTLSALLSNLPCSIFGEERIASLIEYYDSLLDTEEKKTNNIFHFDKNKTNVTHVDEDCLRMNGSEIISKLARKIEDLYNDSDRNRYGLMTLVFHLLKQVTIDEAHTKMTCESLSRIFVHVLESKIFLIKLSNPQQMFRMQSLCKTLIYHAYTVFTHEEWQIKDIVCAQKCETVTISLYNQRCRERRKNKQWRHKFTYKIKASIDDDDDGNATPIPTQVKQPSTTKFISPFAAAAAPQLDSDDRKDNSSDSNSAVRPIVKIRRDSDAIKPDPQDEARRRLSRAHKHSRHLSDDLGGRDITIMMQLDPTRSPLDMVDDEPHVTKDYYANKRHTDPPKSKLNDHQMLYDMDDDSEIENDIDPIPFGHSKNDTIRTDLASFNTFRMQQVSNHALLNDGNENENDSSIDYQSIVDEVDLLSTDDDDDDDQKACTPEPEMDIKSVKSVASEQWLDNMFDEIISEME
eukprot:443954_1